MDRTFAAAAALTALLGAGTLLLAVGHAGVAIPVLSAVGPGGTRPVWPAAGAFTAMTLALGTVVIGLARRRGWAWPAGVGLHALAVLSGLGQYRGVASAVGIVIGAVALALLLSPPGRAAAARH